MSEKQRLADLNRNGIARFHSCLNFTDEALSAGAEAVKESVLARYGKERQKLQEEIARLASENIALKQSPCKPNNPFSPSDREQQLEHSLRAIKKAILAVMEL